VKNLPSDKVFFHFFQNILNARRKPLVAPSSCFCRFIGFAIACLAKNSPFFITQSKWNAVSLSWMEKDFLALKPPHALSMELHCPVAWP
jgi:hypothetical protein